MAPELFLAFGASILVSAPLFVLVHELGHAWAYSRLTGRRSEVLVGRQPARFVRRLSWVELHFDPDLDTRTARAVCKIDPRGLTASQLRQIVLAGPFAGGMLGLVCLAAALGASSDPLSVFFVASAAATLVCLVGTLEDLLVRRHENGELSDRSKLRLLRGRSPNEVLVPPSSGT